VSPLGEQKAKGAHLGVEIPDSVARTTVSMSRNCSVNMSFVWDDMNLAGNFELTVKACVKQVIVTRLANYSKKPFIEIEITFHVVDKVDFIDK
jgi:hypothetical protein